MSGDFFRDSTTPIASKQYVCIACGWFIPKGEKHTAQTGVFDGAGFSNRYHNECWVALRLDHNFDEFMTGDVPVPERFRAEAEAHFSAQRALATQTPASPEVAKENDHG